VNVYKFLFRLGISNTYTILILEGFIFLDKFLFKLGISESYNISVLEVTLLYTESIWKTIFQIPFLEQSLFALHTLRLGGNFDMKAKDAKWLSTLHSLSILELSSMHSLSSSHHWLQSLSKRIPNLTELRLVDCNLLDNDIQSLFFSRSFNISASLTILDLSSNILTSSTLQLLFNFGHHLQELHLSHNNIVR